MNTNLSKAGRIFVDIVFWACLSVTVFILGQIFFFSSFRIPTDSMAPVLITGDNILVFKPIPGARIFNVFRSAEGEQVPIYRMPGIREIRKNDIVVFNFPHPSDWAKIEMHILHYYVKRCVATPGDTLSVVNGIYEVNGMMGIWGNKESQERISQRLPDSFEEDVFHCFPQDSILPWNIKEFGPFYVPKKGDEIAMTRENFLLYNKLIAWEQKAEVIFEENDCYIGGVKSDSYCFLENYYFVAGDMGEDSQDSRYWGLLPEEFIVGKVWLIWKSVDELTGEFRWDRFFKKIDN